MMDDARDRYSRSLAVDTALDLQKIEQEIARLWHPDARGDDSITSLATRASVLNLVVVAPDDDSAEEAQVAAERLSQIHPCRVILFHRVASDTGSFTPDIYATCAAGGEEPDIPCIERIRIPVTSPMYLKLASLMQPLIIPELPAYLWWPAEPSTSDTSFVALARASNLTVVDSLHFRSTATLGALNELGGLLPARSAIADLNWQRLQPWRELTAQCFDIRTVRWALTCIREIEIDAGQPLDRTLPAQALMFSSWLAHCLEWSPFEARRTRDDRWYIGMRDQHGNHVRIIIRTRPNGGNWAGHLLSVNLAAEDRGADTCTLNLSRSRESSLIRMHVRSGLETTIHHAVHHPPLPNEALLVPILETTTRDNVYDSSLEKTVETIDLFGKPEAT
jgi:glucose-6-phosphate dehydrogenase assembly protein OpcA